MTDQLCGIEIAKAFDRPFTTILVCAAKLMPEGPVGILLLVVLVFCTAAVPFVFRYYLGVLGQGAQPEGSLERQDYDKLCASLAGGNLAARLYAKWLTAFLDSVESFFGDAGMADRTLFPHAFGLRKTAPLWTAPSLDRCLLLALVYPIVTVILIWAISGHVGPAEAALGLFPDVPGWQRGLEAAAAGCQGFVLWRFAQTRPFVQLVLVAIYAASAPAFAIEFLDRPDTSRALSLTGAFAFAGSGSGVGSGAFAVALIYPLLFVFEVGAIGVFALLRYVINVMDVSFFLVFLVIGPLVVLLGTGVASVGLRLRAITIKRRWQGVFFLLFIPAMIVACLVAAEFLSHIEKSKVFVSFLLFLVLLTLLNAPFDWASLGLTRALLRRGLELGGWWPFLLALVDAALAVVIITLLALVMVIGVQAFDELAVHGGGKPVLPLDTLFDGIAKNPAAPEYWWAYALLLSSMIPSLINLMISGMAFTRGIPWLARLLLQWIPEGKAVPEYKRQPAAIGLTVQMFAGAGLGIAAQGLLAWGLIFHLMPALGLDLLEMVRAVAAFDLPRQLWQIFARIL